MEKKKLRDFFGDYLMPTKRLFYGDPYGRAGQELRERQWAMCGIDNPSSFMPHAASTSPGGIVIPGVEGVNVQHGFFPPHKFRLLFADTKLGNVKDGYAQTRGFHIYKPKSNGLELEKTLPTSWAWSCWGDADYLYSDEGVHDWKDGSTLYDRWATGSLSYVHACCSYGGSSSIGFGHKASSNKWVYFYGDNSGGQAEIEAYAIEGGGFTRKWGVTETSGNSLSWLFGADVFHIVADNDNVYTFASGDRGTAGGFARICLTCYDRITGIFKWSYLDSESYSPSTPSWDEEATGISIDGKAIVITYRNLVRNSRIIRLDKAGGSIIGQINSPQGDRILHQGSATDNHSNIYVHGELYPDYAIWAYDKNLNPLWEQTYPYKGGEDDGIWGQIWVGHKYIYSVGEFYEGLYSSPWGPWSYWITRLMITDKKTGAHVGSIDNFGWPNKMSLVWDTPSGRIH